MNNSLNAVAGTASSACAETTAQSRVFEDIRGGIAIGHQAAMAALSSLKQATDRLGIPSMYGCAKLQEAPVPVSGEIESAAREMGEFIDLVREIRGLAETIDARL